MDIQATTVASGFAFPECPRWHDGALWFSDMDLSTVFRMSPEGKILESFEVPGRSAGLAWLPDGDLVVVSARERRLYRRKGTTLVPYASLESCHHSHSNDLVIDKNGRAYVSAVGFNYEEGESVRSTSIAIVSPDGKTTLGADDLFAPNGFAISPDGRTLIVAESIGKRLVAFDIGADGTLSGRRSFAELGEHLPDGICLDTEGRVWLASCYAHVVLRVAEGGEILDRIPIKPGNAYACMLGGADGRDLFICCAAGQSTEENMTGRAGRIDVARAPVPRAGLP